jgi:hypothetical protein
MDVGNINYYLTRATEHIYLAQNPESYDNWHNELRNAIKLLILARAKNELRPKNNIRTD